MLNLGKWARRTGITQPALISLNVLIREDGCLLLLSCRQSLTIRRRSRIAIKRGTFEEAKGGGGGEGDRRAVVRVERKREFTGYHILLGIGVPTRTHTFVFTHTRPPVGSLITIISR